MATVLAIAASNAIVSALLAVLALVVTRWVLPTLLPFSFTATSSTMFAIPVLILIRLGPALRRPPGI